MSLTYFKRYRMECDLTRRRPPTLVMPPGYRLVAWRDDLLAEHAETKYQAFRSEIDSQVFECLAGRETCLDLMQQIVSRPGFLPEATWLVEFTGVAHRPEYCGGIQGVKATPRNGGIQNVGVIAEHRGRGLGKLLVAAAVLGFRQAGLRKVYLEVTAENHAALRLYAGLGFRNVKTLYKGVELAATA
ncbi:MAG: GNAT family N-acetyltransferase [Planctomycetota bacterium]